MSSRARTVLAAATTCAALAIPAAAASAEDFCVGDPAGCSGTPVPGPLLSFALKQAQSNGTDDRFVIAPGVFASTNFVHQSGERLQIIGAGADKTILTGNMDGPVLELGGDQDTSVSDLTIEPIGTATSGLTLTGTRAHRVAVDAQGAGSLQIGVSLYGDAMFDHGSVVVGAAAPYAVAVFSGAGAVTDSTLTAPDSIAFVTIGSDAALRRSTLDARQGAIAYGGHLTVTDTLVDLRGHAGGAPALGVGATPNPGGSVSADAERLTIIGSTPSSTTDTVGFMAHADGSGNSATVHARDSVVSGMGVPVARVANNGGTADLTISRSVYPSALATYNTGAGSLVEESRLKVSPGFVGNGDFHLAADSPLIDAGTLDGLPAGATDGDGRPRASDGDGDCAHVPDIGAFEYQGTKVTAIATAAAASVAAGHAVGFSAAGSCIPDPGEPTIHWSFSDGAISTGATVTHAFTTPGRHTATVTVTDADGHSAQATASVEVTAPAAAAPTPSAPRITRLRVAPTRVQIGTTLPKLVRTSGKQPLATIRFTLSKGATVQLRFAKLAERGKTTIVRKRVRINANQGVNRIRFAARLSRRVRLKPGAYRLTTVATDAAGARSNRATARFTAIATKRH